MRLVFPNLFRIDRVDNRALDEPIMIPMDPEELKDMITDAYESFLKWSDSRPEPFLMGEKVGYDISRSCTVGKVVSFELERDGIPSIAEVDYQNFGKSSIQNEIIDRAARSLVKLFK